MTGLVLEGGGMRGIYTAGVLDGFGENGISFDGVIGVSAGAIHGCSYLSGQFGRSIRYYKKYCGDPRFMGWKCYLKTGDFVGADFCYHELPEQLDLFTDVDAAEKQRQKEAEEYQKEKHLQRAVLHIHKKYGKNALLKGMNLLEGATMRERNEQVGGHKA